MKVVLRTDIAGVGKRGDIVNVSGGFTRNYLFPEGRGILATKGVEAQAEAMRKARDLREAHDREAAETQRGILSGAVLRIEARTGKSGRLFGSVGVTDIVHAVAEQKGIELDRHQVAHIDPIKAVGTHTVTLNLFDDIAAELQIEVVAAS